MQLVTKGEGNASLFQEDPWRRRGFTTKLGGMWSGPFFGAQGSLCRI